MSDYRDIIHIFREVSRIAYEYEGYNRNSYIVEGSRRLASMIEGGFFPEENCHWIAKSILPHNRYHIRLFYAINHHFDASFAELMQILVHSLVDVTRNYTPEREGMDNPYFHRIFTTPGEQFTTFFPGNASNSEFESDSDSEIDSEDEDDFIDPENAPAYEQYDGPLPLYENIHQDELLLEGPPPIYSEFSLRMMRLSMERGLA